MPLISRVQAVRLRRQAPLVAALLAVAAFTLFHQIVFGTLAARRARALRQAVALGAALDPSNPALEPPIPPRVFSLLMDNSLPGAEADRRNQSGELGAEMVQKLSALAERHGLDVIVAEPGLSTQQSGSIEVRAHLKLAGSYPGFVSLLDDMTGDGRLWQLENFVLQPGPDGRCQIEIHVAGCVLRRTGSAS